MTFEKQSNRDNTMYELGQFGKNVRMEFTREEREREIEERKKNRSKYRNFSSILKHYRTKGRQAGSSYHRGLFLHDGKSNSKVSL